jgi:TolB-like protein
MVLAGISFLNSSAWATPAVLLYQIENQHPEQQMQGVEKRAATLVEELLQRLGRWRVLDRQSVKVDTKEGMNQDTLTRLKGQGVDYLITGILTGTELATEITLKFIKTDTGQIEKTIKAANITTPHIEPIIRKFYTRFQEAFPLSGKIIQIKADKTYVNLGSSQGLKQGDSLEVIRITEVKDGDKVVDVEEEKIGRLTIDKVMEKSAWGTYTPLPGGKSAAVGLVVKTTPPPAAPSDANLPPKEIIALKRFANVSGQEKLNHIGEALAESLTTSLTSLKNFRVVDRMQLEKVLEEQRLGSAWIFNPGTTVESGQLWNPRYIISGSYQQLDRNYRLDAHLVDLETAEVISAESIIGKELFELTDRLGQILLSNLDRKKALKDSRIAGLKVEVAAVEQLPMAIYHLLPSLEARIIEITVKNDTGRKQRLLLSAEITGITQAAKETVEIDPGQEGVFSLYPPIIPGKLREITTARTNPLSVQAVLPDGAIVFEETRSTNLLPYDSLVFQQSFIRSNKDLLTTVAAWASPNLPEASTILGEAARRTSKGSLTGYQATGFLSGKEDETNAQQHVWTREQVQAIYDSLKDKDLRYVEQSTQFPDANLQRVLLPQDALKQKGANCIDGSLLFASLMLRAGLNPIIIIVPGHAFVGWETWESSGEYEYMETTKLGYSDFASALQEGKKQAQEAGLDQDITSQAFKEFKKQLTKGSAPTGKAQVLNIRVLKNKMADIPI